MGKNILTPLRRPFFDLSKAAFVITLKAEVRAPDAARPAKYDCEEITILLNRPFTEINKRRKKRKEKL